MDTQHNNKKSPSNKISRRKLLKSLPIVALAATVAATELNPGSVDTTPLPDNPILCWNAQPVTLSRILEADAWREQAERVRSKLFHTGCYPLKTTATNEKFDSVETEARSQLGNISQGLSRDDALCLYGLARLMTALPMPRSLIDHTPKSGARRDHTPEEDKEWKREFLIYLTGFAQNLATELAA